MSITNTSKPSTSLTNSTKIDIQETWDSNTTTWNTETRTWDGTSSKIGNIIKVFGGVLWASQTLPWQLPTPWIDTGNIINIAKP